MNHNQATNTLASLLDCENLTPKEREAIVYIIKSKEASVIEGLKLSILVINKSFKNMKGLSKRTSEQICLILSEIIAGYGNNGKTN